MLSVMNSLNIVSRLTTTPPPSPPRSRTGSTDEGDLSHGGDGIGSQDFGSIEEKLAQASQEGAEDVKLESADADGKTYEEELDEKTPLLASSESTAGASNFKEAPGSRLWSIPRRVGSAIIHGVKVVFTTITAPGRYVIACFYDDNGHFSTIMPLRNFKNLLNRSRRRNTAQAIGLNAAPESTDEKRSQRKSSNKRSQSVDSNASSSTAVSSDEADTSASDKNREDSPARHTRSRTAAANAEGEEIAPQKKSIKIKLHNDETLRKRRAAKEAAAKQKRAPSSSQPTSLDDVAAALKSPTSTHNTKMTRYPRAPAPPRPLVPRRQPSYTLSYAADTPKKTLIIDLDETLIHSMAKGGRMSTGHMVEVRLGGPVPAPPTSNTSGSQPATVNFGPGVPILYYVHERPNCHEFLRKVSKWYNLIVFTASVQEYADPVIDWLERERRYFSGRFYRQHCTLRNGAYIKDLAQVEPDLSRVMILDNSPMSYIFHEGKRETQLRADLS
jgi:CTD nuclear envelope phosphatase 1